MCVDLDASRVLPPTRWVPVLIPLCLSWQRSRAQGQIARCVAQESSANPKHWVGRSALARLAFLSVVALTVAG